MINGPMNSPPLNTPPPRRELESTKTGLPSKEPTKKFGGSKRSVSNGKSHEDNASSLGKDNKNIGEKEQDKGTTKTSLFDLSKNQRTQNQQTTPQTTSSSQEKTEFSKQIGEQTEQKAGQTTAQEKSSSSQTEVSEEKSASPSSQQQTVGTQKQQSVVPGRELPTASSVDEQQGQITKASSKEDEGEGKKKSSSVEGRPEGRPESASFDLQAKPGPTQIGTEVSGEEKAEAPRSIQQIADQIVEKIQVTRTGDRIDTAITLKSPPMLDGATVTVTSSATAKGEIQLSFSNLSTEGKQLIDQNSASLKETLEKNGYKVHDVVTIPKEIQGASLASEASREQQREGQGDRGQQGEGQRERERQQQRQQQQQRNR